MSLPAVYASPFWKMSFARETTFNTAIPVASVNKYIGVVHRDFEIPVPEQTLTQNLVPVVRNQLIPLVKKEK